MATTYYLAIKLLNHVLRGPSSSSPAAVYTQPNRCWVALFTTSPGNDYPTTPGTEVSTSGTGYQREGLDFNDPTLPDTLVNALDVTFTTAASSWGTITTFGIFDAQTNGNLLYYAPLTASRQVLTGDIIKFPAGQLTIQCT